MEFVFAVEDRFDVRIPEERLDPRQAGVTLEQLALADRRGGRGPAGERCRRCLARAAGAPVAVTGAGVVEPDRQRRSRPSTRRCSPGARRSGRRRSTCRASTCRRSPVAPRRLRRRGGDRAVRRAARPRHGDGAGGRRATPRAAAGLVAGGFDPERLGVFWGSGMAGAATFEATCRTVYADRRRMRPTSVVTTMPNAPVAELALHFGARGAALAYASRLRLVGGGDRRGDAGDPRRLDRRRHRRRQRVDADARACWRAGRRCGCWRRSARRRRRRRGRRLLPARSPPIATASPSARRRRRFVLESAGARRARAAPRSRRCSPATPPTATASTSPSPMPPARRGRCARRSPTPAWRRSDIGYLNAHGTATLGRRRRRGRVAQPRVRRRAACR